MLRKKSLPGYRSQHSCKPALVSVPITKRTAGAMSDGMLIYDKQQADRSLTMTLENLRAKGLDANVIRCI